MAPAPTTPDSAPAPAVPERAPAAPADRFERGGRTTGVAAPVRPDAAERQAHLDRMLRNLPPDAPLRGRVAEAAESFSTAQLRRMDQAGVVFADESGVPASRALEDTNGSTPLRTPGRYLPEGRVIQLRSSAGPAHARHEMAHAWDDVRNDRLRFDDGASQVQRERMIARLNLQDARGQLPELRRRAERMPAGSEGRRRTEASIREIETRARREPAAFESDTRLRGAFDAYRARMQGRPREAAFDYAARQGHSLRSPREFYAEGFNAFHGSAHARERVRETAPELYRVLYAEARASGTLPTGATPP